MDAKRPNAAGTQGTYDTEDWFHILHTPDGVHVHHVDRTEMSTRTADVKRQKPTMSDLEAQGTAVGDMAEVARGELRFPTDYRQRGDWDSMLSPGLPHRTLLGRIPVDAQGVPACAKCVRPDAQT